MTSLIASFWQSLNLLRSFFLSLSLSCSCFSSRSALMASFCLSTGSLESACLIAWSNSIALFSLALFLAWSSAAFLSSSCFCLRALSLSSLFFLLNSSLSSRFFFCSWETFSESSLSFISFIAKSWYKISFSSSVAVATDSISFFFCFSRSVFSWVSLLSLMVACFCSAVTSWFSCVFSSFSYSINSSLCFFSRSSSSLFPWSLVTIGKASAMASSISRSFFFCSISSLSKACLFLISASILACFSLSWALL
mmetsp:Transcript_2117/g.1981  ORF Transcript_2117/g.1981 Transcript_2117/m.1981 type:complete len:252 (-) Transcript_2117:619-1374(-)